MHFSTVGYSGFYLKMQTFTFIAYSETENQPVTETSLRHFSQTLEHTVARALSAT
jgi:hypothetical protein